VKKNRTIGFWIIMTTGILLLVELVIGQTMSFVDYDFAVSIGLQESKDIVGEMGVAINKGFGVGDTIIYIPILTLGLIGLWSRRMWGVFAMAGVFAITAYWPMVNLFFLLFAKSIPGFNFTNFTLYTIILTIITLYALWGLWYLYTHRNTLAPQPR
jgi:hypothetical protein